MKKCLVIYTPFSFKGKIENFLSIIKDKLATNYEVSTYRTKGPKDGTKFVKEKGSNYDLIVVAGGDGLINEVVNGLMHLEVRPQIGVLPMGTVNDISHSFEISQNMNKALDIVLKEKACLADVVSINDFYATYVCCVGEYTNSTYNTKQDSKRKMGWFAYFFEAVRGVFKKQKHRFDVYIDGDLKMANAIFVMVINSRRVAGFMLNKNALLNDGEFDIVAIKKPKGFFGAMKKYYTYAKLFTLGIDKIRKHSNVLINRANNAKIVNYTNSVLNVDGEGIESPQEVTFGVVKSAINIIVPKEKK